MVVEVELALVWSEVAFSVALGQTVEAVVVVEVQYAVLGRENTARFACVYVPVAVGADVNDVPRHDLSP